MRNLFNISLSLYQVAIAFIGIVNIVFFLASGHSFNFEDIEQLKLFLSSILFITTFFLLFAWKRAKETSERTSLYKPSIVCLFASFVGLIYILSELLKVKYGDTKPYLIFLTLSISMATNIVLLYIFLFKKEIALVVHKD